MIHSSETYTHSLIQHVYHLPAHIALPLWIFWTLSFCSFAIPLGSLHRESFWQPCLTILGLLFWPLATSLTSKELVSVAMPLHFCIGTSLARFTKAHVNELILEDLALENEKWHSCAGKDEKAIAFPEV